MPVFILLAVLPAASAVGALSKSQGKTVWHPKVGDSFQIQLSGTLNTKIVARIYDIDLFDTSTAQIGFLKKADRKVVCYFSAGSSENWRPDFKKFLASDMGHPLQGWPGENWLDIRSGNVHAIMMARISLASKKGCDAIDPDNVDGYSNSSGFKLTAKNQLDYNKFLSEQAHLRGLAIGLKNDVGQVSALSPWFGFAVNEQCHEFNECSEYLAFTSRGKPVLNIEYQTRYVKNTDGAFVTLCKASRVERLYTLVLPLSLEGTPRLSCDGK